MKFATGHGCVVLLVGLMLGSGPGRAAEPGMSVQSAIMDAVAVANAQTRHETVPEPLYIKKAELIKSPLWGTLWAIRFECEPARKVIKPDKLLDLIEPWSFEVRVQSPVGEVKAMYVSQPVGRDAAGIPVGTLVPGKKGFCVSPNAYYASYVDVRLFDPGMIVRCPYSGLPFIIPEPEK